MTAPADPAPPTLASRARRQLEQRGRRPPRPRRPLTGPLLVALAGLVALAVVVVEIRRLGDRVEAAAAERHRELLAAVDEVLLDATAAADRVEALLTGDRPPDPLGQEPN